MPWTLYRYILREVLKVMVLSTTVLVVVICFAAAIKPLSEGLLGAASFGKFILYTIPTMVGLAIPFAAAFATTLVFSRMANDNEIVACRAGGLSYAAVLTPIIFLGLVLTVSVFYLSNWVVPRFYLLAQQQLEHDMINVLVNQIGKRQTFKRDRMILYADAADDTMQPPRLEGDIQPSKMLVLQGVAVGRIDRDGRLRREGIAERADVFLFRMEHQTMVTMRLTNVMLYEEDASSDGGGQGRLFFSGKWDVPPVPLPNLFKDRLAFLSGPQLQELGRHPENHGPIKEAKSDLAETIAAEQLSRSVEAKLRDGGGKGIELLSPGDHERLVVSAPRVHRNKEGLRLAADGDTPVRVDVVTAGMPARRIEAAAGELEIEPDTADGEPLVRVELRRALVFDPRVSSRGVQHEKFKLPRGRWPTPIREAFENQSATDLIRLAADGYGDSTPVRKAHNDLVHDLIRLGRKAVAKLHERAASATGCMLLLVLGAVLSLHLRGRTPLVIYFWSFLLATLAVVIARSGENMASDPEANATIGKIVIWSGNLVVLGVMLGLYWKVSRN